MLWQQLSIPVRNSDTRADRCKFTVISIKHNIQSTRLSGLLREEGRKRRLRDPAQDVVGPAKQKPEAGVLEDASGGLNNESDSAELGPEG